MSTRPAVSVLMPSYNHAAYVREAVRSVWAQDYRPLELIVVDDGSTDGSRAILEEMQRVAPIPMSVLSSDRKGVAGALNMAVGNASGEYLSIIASDDAYRVDKVSKQVAALRGRNDVVLVHSEFVVIDPVGTPTGYTSAHGLPAAKGLVLRELLLSRADIRSVTVLVNHAALREIGGYDERYPAEDWVSFLRLAKLGVVEHVPEPLVFRRVHAWNLSSTSSRSSDFDPRDFGFDAIREVIPPDMSIEEVCTLHAAVVVRNALAQGGWRKGALGIAFIWRSFRSQRHRVPAIVASGLRSYLWLRVVRDRIPKSALRRLLLWKRRPRSIQLHGAGK